MSGSITVGGKILASHDNVSGKLSMSENVVFPAGHVIQVKHFIFSKLARTNSTTYTQITDGSVNFELDITPKKPNSKILILSNIQIGSTGQNGFHLNLYRKIGTGSYTLISDLLNTSTTSIGINAAQGGLPIGTAGYERFNFALQYLDESITTLDQRYYSFYYRTGSSTSQYAVVNATPSAYGGSTNVDFGKSSSQLTLMEISA